MKIVKYGRVGSDTEGTLSGVNFTLEKWDETAKEWKSVTVSDKDGKAFNLKTDKTVKFP